MSDNEPLREDRPPPTNVAEAYPTTRNPVPRLLAVVTFFGACLALIVHRVDHPATRKVRAALNLDKPAAPPHLAVCYSGHVGTLAHVYEQNIKAIRSVDPEAAFFYYIDLKDDYHHETTGTHYDLEHEIGALQPVFDAAKARAVKTYTADEVETPPEGVCYKRNGASPSHYTNHYIQFYAARQCYGMIQEAEAHGEKFDWILRLQPNMNIAVRLPLASVKPRVHLSGAAMALIPRQMGDVFFSVVDAFTDDKCRPMDQLGDTPCKNYSYPGDSVECLIIKWLQEAYIKPSNGAYVNRRIIYPTDGE